jgi:hypothetical protein
MGYSWQGAATGEITTVILGIVYAVLHPTTTTYLEHK